MSARPVAALAAVAACLLAGCGSGGSSGTVSTTTHGGSNGAATHQVAQVKVPKLVGERFGHAVQLVKRAGLEQEAPHFTGTVGNPHYNGTCQRVLHQSPPPGARVAKGSTVAIVYGVCPRSIIHPKTAMKQPTKRGSG
jgi:hypothetical protein